MDIILEGIVENSIAISGIIMLVFLARLLLKKAPRSFSYVLWFFVLIRILCPITVEGVYTLLPEKVENNVSGTVDILQDRQTNWMKQTILASGRAEESKSESDKGELNTAGDTSSETFVWNLTTREGKNTASEGDGFLSGVSLYDVFGIVWIVGFALLSAYLIVNMILAHRRLRDAIPVGDNVYKSDAVANSLVCGLFRPHIYINPRICEGNMDYILAHENCHVRRLDYIVKPAAFLIFSTNWFNPLVWVAYRLMMKDMEMSCDEKVMKRLGSAAKKEYSYLLLTMAEKEELRFQQTPAFGGMVVKQRIRNVLSYKRPAALTLAAAVLIIGVCGCSVFSSPDKPEQKTTVNKEAGEAQYVEQKLSLNCAKSGMFGTTKKINHSIESGHIQDMEGNVYAFADEVITKDKTLRDGKPLAKKLSPHEDGCSVEEVDLPWADEVWKYTDKKNMYLQERYFGRDGKLYQRYNTFNRMFRTDDTEDDMDSFYITDECLIQIDMKTNKWQEITLPERTEKGEDGRITNSIISVQADGNLLINSLGDFAGLYTPDGKQLRELQTGGYYLSGDGEYFKVTYGDDHKSKSIEVYNETTGEKTNEIMLDKVKDGLEQGEITGLSYAAGCFYIICSKGIYRAETGEKEFTLAVDPERDKTFTLGKSDNRPCSLFVDAETENFWAVFCSNTISETNEFMCTYKKK